MVKGGWLKGLGLGFGGRGGVDEWQSKTVAPNGKLLVAVAALRFGELPDLLGALPRLEAEGARHEAVGRRIKSRLGGCMEQVAAPPPTPHPLSLLPSPLARTRVPAKQSEQ